MKTISIIQADELGPDFRLEGGIWKVNFPAGDEPNKVISDDVGNAIKKGTDGGGFISEDLLSAYALVQDTSAQKIHLYSFPAGTEFDVTTATLVSTVNLIEMNGVFDDVAIDDAVLTFTDADTGQTLSLDTRTLQRIGDITAGEGITVSELNGVLTIAVKLLDSADNLLEATPDGLLLSKESIAGLLDFDGSNNVQRLIPMEDGTKLAYIVGDEQLIVPQMMITNTSGDILTFVPDVPEEGLISIKIDGEGGNDPNPNPTTPNVTYTSPRVHLSTIDELYGRYSAYVDGVLVVEEFFNFYELSDALVAMNSPINIEFISYSGIPPKVVITNMDENTPHLLEIRDETRYSTYPNNITYNSQARVEYDRRGFKSLIIPLDVFSIEKPSEFNFLVYPYPAFPESAISNDGIDLEMTIGDTTISGFLSAVRPWDGLYEWDTFTKRLEESNLKVQASIAFGLSARTMDGGVPVPDDAIRSLSIRSFESEEVEVKIKGPISGIIDLEDNVPMPWVTKNPDGSYTMQFTWSIYVE